ncbi:MAG: virulence factor BrkB family protein [Gammaproteobacteria bacterium]|nr:MAG: virulence factor BrkB family protein [Gammaproteobacteria bacterium]
MDIVGWFNGLKIGNVKLFLRFLIGRFISNKSTQSATILSYTTLLSIVPLFAVCFSLIAAFPVVNDLRNDIQQFIFNNFIPASGEHMQQYFNEFIGKASKLTGPGILGLVITALLLMSTIDAAMNKIWGVKATRNRIYEFIVYWAVLTLGPLLIGLSLAVTSYMFSLPFLAGEGGAISKPTLLRMLPFISEALAFTFIYMVLPNRKVNFLHALSGAMVAAILFELAKKGFALFVTQFSTYQAIYGALASIPIFLIWVYLSWLVVLFGAEFAHALGSYKQSDISINLDTGMEFVLAVRIIGHLWQAQMQGEQRSRSDFLNTEKGLDELTLNKVMGKLEEAQIVAISDKGNWLLCRDVERLTLLDLYRSDSYSLPPILDGWAKKDDLNVKLADIISVVDKDIDVAFSKPIVTLFSDNN